MIKITILILLLIAAWFGLRSLEPRSLFYPDRTMMANPSVSRMAYEDLHLLAEDGTKIHGWWIPAAHPGGPTILFCHGNAGNISHRLDKAVRLHQAGAALLFFDYRGYGLSAGTPSEQGTYQDAEAAYQWFVKREALGMPPEIRSTPHIVFYGESLGCAVATEMAVRHPEARGLLLESPFTSTVAMAKRIFPWLPVRWIIRYRYDTLSKIPKIKMPLLILHSPQDEIVPFEMGKELFAAAPEPKRLVEMQGGHNDGYVDFGERYIAEIRRFLESLPITPPASGGPR